MQNPGNGPVERLRYSEARSLAAALVSTRNVIRCLLIRDYVATAGLRDLRVPRFWRRPVNASQSKKGPGILAKGDARKNVEKAFDANESE